VGHERPTPRIGGDVQPAHMVLVSRLEGLFGLLRNHCHVLLICLPRGTVVGSNYSRVT
jgi:hypothetical protein